MKAWDIIKEHASIGTKDKRDWGPTGTALIPPRTPGMTYSQPQVNEQTAMRQSAVWACLRLRADLISTFPWDIYRMVNGQQIEMPKPPFFQNPTEDGTKFHEWLYMSQIELDRSGNFIGIITEKDSSGRPMKIEPQASTNIVIQKKDGKIYYRIGSEVYEPADIYHERQFPVAGMMVGLSPVAYAAWTLSEYVSIQQFTTSWFSGGAVPRARLRNVERTFTDTEALEVKESWRASIAMNEPFVHGSDWEYDLMQAQQASADWLSAKNSDTVEIARFFGVPADLIDAAIHGESITYANITQRNLQFLIMNLGPAIFRREANISDLLAKPRFFKLNANALLRMTPTERYAVYEKARALGTMTVNEIRALEDMPPMPGSVGDIPMGESLMVGMSRGAAQIPSAYAPFLEPAPQLAPTLPDGTLPSQAPQEGN